MSALPGQHYLEQWDEQVVRLHAEIKRLRAVIIDCPCPGGGYNGQPSGDDPTVGNCIKSGMCGCDIGAALEAK